MSQEQKDGLFCSLMRRIQVVGVAIMLSWLLIFAVPAAAQSDDCFTLPNGTKFCSSQREKPSQRSNSPATQKPVAVTKPVSRSNKPSRLRRRAGNPIQAAGGHKYLIERFDASAVPSLKLAGPCLCRDGTEPVYEFCTGRDGTYKVSCSR